MKIQDLKSGTEFRFTANPDGTTRSLNTETVYAVTGTHFRSTTSVDYPYRVGNYKNFEVEIVTE